MNNDSSFINNSDTSQQLALQDEFLSEKDGSMSRLSGSTFEQRMADGIAWTLDGTRYKQLSKASRQKVIDNYSEDKVAGQYIQLYQSLLN